MAIAIIPEETIKEVMEKIDRILSQLDKMVDKKPPRTEYTVKELSQIKGYSRATILRIIHNDHIPYQVKGKDVVIKASDAGRIKEKVSITKQPGRIPAI